MRKILLFGLAISLVACEFSTSTTTEIRETKSDITYTEVSKDSINKVIEKWHAAAANANYDAYFNLMAGDGVFIGTDATENWQNQEFRDFAKPYFDNGKAWDFTTLERNIYASENGQIAWFDELLNTQMGICRGSGVLSKENGDWKIKHYVLSIAIPNENVSDITNIKKERDSILISKLK